jgi:ubiquitin conjugation factor E4 B
MDLHPKMMPIVYVPPKYGYLRETQLLLSPKIRLKRLAKLQQIASASSSTPSSSASGSLPPTAAPSPTTAKPKGVHRSSVPSAPQSPTTPRPALGLAKRKTTVIKLDLATWEHESIGNILKVTLEVCLVPRRS